MDVATLKNRHDEVCESVCVCRERFRVTCRKVVLTLVMHCSVPSRSNPHTKFANCLVQLCVCVRMCGGGGVRVGT